MRRRRKRIELGDAPHRTFRHRHAQADVARADDRAGESFPSRLLLRKSRADGAEARDARFVDFAPLDGHHGSEGARHHRVAGLQRRPSRRARGRRRLHCRPPSRQREGRGRMARQPLSTSRLPLGRPPRRKATERGPGSPRVRAEHAVHAQLRTNWPAPLRHSCAREADSPGALRTRRRDIAASPHPAPSKASARIARTCSRRLAPVAQIVRRVDGRAPSRASQPAASS